MLRTSAQEFHLPIKYDLQAEKRRMNLKASKTERTFKLMHKSFSSRFLALCASKPCPVNISCFYHVLSCVSALVYVNQCQRQVQPKHESSSTLLHPIHPPPP